MHLQVETFEDRYEFKLDDELVVIPERFLDGTAHKVEFPQHKVTIYVTVDPDGEHAIWLAESQGEFRKKRPAEDDDTIWCWESVKDEDCECLWADFYPSEDFILHWGNFPG